LTISFKILAQVNGKAVLSWGQPAEISLILIFIKVGIDLAL